MLSFRHYTHCCALQESKYYYHQLALYSYLRKKAGYLRKKAEEGFLSQLILLLGRTSPKLFEKLGTFYDIR